MNRQGAKDAKSFLGGSGAIRRGAGSTARGAARRCDVVGTGARRCDVVGTGRAARVFGSKLGLGGVFMRLALVFAPKPGLEAFSCVSRLFSTPSSGLAAFSRVSPRSGYRASAARRPAPRAAPPCAPRRPCTPSGRAAPLRPIPRPPTSLAALAPWRPPAPRHHAPCPRRYLPPTISRSLSTLGTSPMTMSWVPTSSFLSGDGL